MRRIAYSPEVRVYIQPSIKDKDGNLVSPIDISDDIIEGSIERRSNDISTARFVLQGRRIGKSSSGDATTSILLSQKIRPMDRIVVYLKKTKPILVFSGFIDMVPLIQFVPEPVVIEASCSLKKLKYTYWDPTLPNVMQAFLQMGMMVENSANGFTVSQPPGKDDANGAIEDQGFPKLLSFLLIDVGGWDPESVYIEPLPQAWLDYVEPMFRNMIETDGTWESAKTFLEAWLGASDTGGGDGGGDDDGGGETTISGEIAEKIKNYIEDKTNNATVTAEDFIKAGKKHNIDPRFLVVMSYWETNIGTNKNSQAGTENDMFGLENGVKYPSLAAGIVAIAKAMRVSGDYIYNLTDYPNLTAIQGIRGWNRGNLNTKAAYEDSFIKEYESLGGNPNKIFSITAQGIGDSINNSRRNPATGAGARNDTGLSVYIEAFGCGDKNQRIPGYQKQDVFGRSYLPVYKEDGEITDPRIYKNVDMAERIRDRVNDIIRDKINKKEIPSGSDPINFKVITDQSGLVIEKNNIGWSGDLFLAIDHSKQDRDSKIGYFSVPSLNTPELKKPGNIEPGEKNYGTAWAKPIRKINQKALVSNSNQFIQSLNRSKDKGKSNSNNGALNFTQGSDPNASGNAALAWKGVIPEFYYTNSFACVYLQLPNYAEHWDKRMEDYSWQIAHAIVDYWQEYKVKKRNGGQKEVDEVAVTRSEESSVELDYVEPNFNGKSTGKLNDAIKKVVGYYQAKFPSMKVGDTYDSPNHKSGSMHWNGEAVDLYADKSVMDEAAKWTKDVGLYDVFKKYGMAIYQGSSSEYNLSGARDGGGEVSAPSYWDKGGNAGTWDNHKDHHHIGIYKEDSKDALKAMANLSSSSSDSSSSDSSSDSQSYQDAINFNRAAFNVTYNFPGSMIDSFLLRGHRALQNDVPLLDSVRDIALGSMRNFCSLPNGDFIAWYPDYFNIARRNPWLRISAVEIKKCTIDFSDKALATHVYIMGNPWGPMAATQQTAQWYEYLQGAGIVTIEQQGILDSFLGNLITSSQLRTPIESDSQTQDALDFLERYGARPYTESNLTIRHPIVEFFYAYNTFITKWAEQFISRVEFTFMPELFPGMIIEIPNYQEDDKYYSFYVQDVSHSFNYTTGFSTSAILIAPGQVFRNENVPVDKIGMVPVRPPGMERLPTKTTGNNITPANPNAPSNTTKPGNNSGRWQGPTRLPGGI